MLSLITSRLIDVLKKMSVAETLLLCFSFCETIGCFDEHALYTRERSLKTNITEELKCASVKHKLTHF